MKSKILRRVRLAIRRSYADSHNIREAQYWRDQVRFWRTTDRFGVWNDETCSRLAGEAEKAAVYFERGAIGSFPKINMSV